jgi:hypothetical protein
MDWIKKHWRSVLQAGCAVTGGVALAVPALAPAALACAVAIPTLTTAKNWKSAVTDIMALLK